jgi:hypothetical protein
MSSAHHKPENSLLWEVPDPQPSSTGERRRALILAVLHFPSTVNGGSGATLDREVRRLQELALRRLESGWNG